MQNTNDVVLSDIVKTNTKRYGSHVIGHRAVPDFRDGLKPVHRRILWAMYKMGLKPKKQGGHMAKSARIVGEVMGKYHPHGDASIYSAMVNLCQSQLNANLIYGEGNWGDYSRPPAAMRYTECTLSALAASMFDNDYLQVIPYFANYDGRENEPLYLPAKIPYLLLGGMAGIAVGTATNFPPFAVKGVLKLTRLAFERDLTAKDFLKYLQIDYITGSDWIDDPKDKLNYFKVGNSRLNFAITPIVQGKTLVLNSLPPHFNFASWRDKMLENDEVMSVTDETSSQEPVRIVIHLKKNLTDRQVKAFALNFSLGCGINAQSNVTERLSDEDFKFFNVHYVQFMRLWKDYRIELEEKVIKFRISECLKEIHRLELLLLVPANIDTIVRVVKAKHANREALDKALAKALKISQDDAHIILDMPLHRLSKLQVTELKAKLADAHALHKKLKADLKNPTVPILADLANLEKIIGD